MNSIKLKALKNNPSPVTSGLQTILLSCGILSSAIYVIADISAGLVWSDYNYTNQTVSELFAIGAPSRTVVVPFFILYALLIYLFGFGIWLSHRTNRSLRIASILIIGKEVLGLFGTLFAPIHLRGMQGTISDTLHGIITAVGVLLFMFPAMIFGAAAFGKKFRIYSIITMITFLVFGTLTGLQGQALAENLPTPFMGIWERINIYGYMLWIIVLSIVLLRNKN